MLMCNLQKPLVAPNDLLYFADICAGPGGFSEYVLWRKGWDAKGFGFTLKGPNDFKLEDFFAAPCELFEPHYGTASEELHATVCLMSDLFSCFFVDLSSFAQFSSY